MTMLIDLLQIANTLEFKAEEAVFDQETGTFQIWKGNDNPDDTAIECIMDNLSFKEVAMYATGLANQTD
jgi:cell division FtsZ-interacting protein ZapD